MSHRPQSAVELFLSFGDGNVAYLDRQTRLLQRELTAIGVSADIAREMTPPEGARGAAEIIGLLQVATLLPIVVPKLIDVLQTWLAGRKGAMIKLKVGDVELEVDASAIDSARALLADASRLANNHASS